MATRKRTIRVETRSLSVIHSAQSAVDLWCDECGAVVAMVTPEHAASLCHRVPRAIYRMVERSELHFTEVAGARLLVCVNSLRENGDGNVEAIKPEEG